MSAYGRHLANTIEPSLIGSDAVCRYIVVVATRSYGNLHYRKVPISFFNINVTILTYYRLIRVLLVQVAAHWNAGRQAKDCAAISVLSIDDCSTARLQRLQSCQQQMQRLRPPLHDHAHCMQ